jgi:hypothetical protein
MNMKVDSCKSSIEFVSLQLERKKENKQAKAINE